MTRFAWTDARVRDALGWLPAETESGVSFSAVTTDSRAVSDGDLFVALEGDRFDGHDYVAQAVAGGARGVVVSRRVEAGAAAVYPVSDTRRALGLLARYRRRALDARVVGITGSAGKTTTKDMTRGALEATLRVHATQGNLNNQIGVPLTLLSAPENAQVLVVEMGTNEPGEIGILAAIAEPDVGMVTTVSETHVEKLGSLEGVLHEKLDLIRAVPPEGTAVVGDDPPILAARARSIRSDVRVAGTTMAADSDLRPVDLTYDRGHARFQWRGATVTLAVPGRHNVGNALLALAVAELLGVDPTPAAKGVSSVAPAAMRGEVRTVGTLTVIVDCYNANPQSVRAALDLLTDLSTAGGSVAILGSMLELGDLSDGLHEALLAEALDRDLRLAVATGEFAAAADRMPRARTAMQEHRLMVARDPMDAYGDLATRLEAGQTVLLKGSRGVRLEQLLEPLARDFAGKGEVA